MTQSRQELERQAQLQCVVPCAAKLMLGRAGAARSKSWFAAERTGWWLRPSPGLVGMFDGCDFGVESWYLGYATVDILFLLSVFSQTFFCIFLCLFVIYFFLL